MSELKAAAERRSRTQESREAEPIHEPYDDAWEPQGLLDTSLIPPRDGMCQRWVRTKILGDDDPNNVGRALNQGYRPRMADTVPKGAFVSTIQHEQYGSVIGMHDMMLMERPEHLDKLAAKRQRVATDSLQKAVDENMFRVHEPGQGVTAPRRSLKTQVVRGRQPRAQSDD